MKHSWKVTLILLGMFLITQLIGLAVIHTYSAPGSELPFGMQPPEDITPTGGVSSILIAFAFAVGIILLLMKFQLKIILRYWFFFVVIVALGITINALFLNSNIPAYVGLIIALPLAFYKVFRRHVLIHNLTELLIYPGIASVFVPILNIWTILLLLILISIYDIYAVWHFGFMQKMAKFQMNEVKVFGGFMVPSISKKDKLKIQELREKYKTLKLKGKKLKQAKIKVSLGILGGGDVVFPLILAGVVLKTLGLLPALIVSLSATLALFFLFLAAKKAKFYPAMPFITAGCLVGLFAGYLINLI